VTYQWFKSNESDPIAGANSPELDVRINSEQDWDVYRCSVVLDCNTKKGTNKALIYNMLPIQVSPEQVQVGVDHQVQLQCIVDASYKAEQCRWYKDDQLIHDQHSLVLTIQNPTSQTSGAYKCEAISEIYGTLKSQVAQVRCSVPPVITSPVAHTTVSLGESVEFRCEASGDNLTYQWINEKTGAPIPGACHSVYRINECSMMDFGSYVCSVQNEAGLVSQSDMYIVRRRHNQASLRVTLPDSLDVKLGTEAKMRVHLSDERQEYTYQWYFKGQVSSSLLGDQELIIPNVGTHNQGVYSCVVCNQFGEKFESNLLHLNVMEPLPIRVQFQSLSVKVGEDTSFGVDVDGESHMSYQYRWFKDDKPITATSSAGKIYHLGPVSEDMAGTYYCEVSNSCGQKETVPVAQITINQGHTFPLYSSTSSSLTVFSGVEAGHSNYRSQIVPADSAEAASYGTISYESINYQMPDMEEEQSSLGPYQSCQGPKIVIQPEEQEIDAGQELCLSCGALGTRKMNYQWYFNGRPFGDKTDFNAIKILKATPQHRGHYYCEVANYKARVSTAVVSVIVKDEKPWFDRNPKPFIQIPEGKPMNLPWKIAGKEPINIQWKKDGRVLTDIFTGGEKGHLAIPEAKESDSGEYVCVISNSYGQVESRPTHVYVDSS
jgi:hypothetical protein